MADYRLSRRAVADLDRIWRFSTENWSEHRAERYTDGIIATIEALADGRRTGRKHVGKEVCLKYPAGSHNIFYAWTDDGVLVIRILHQRMDPDRHL